MKYKNIKEEELKNKVGQDWFKQSDNPIGIKIW